MNTKGIVDFNAEYTIAIPASGVLHPSIPKKKIKKKEKFYSKFIKKPNQYK